ncbi:hypothetical protein T05_6737 [Trichinella murrelli]|uniref:Uncharacterized protein n=1 Tax=Trichinella murrelli TaxID=144512 RepID=A0A0V0TCC2_9BILA|nr:hypothetical protein T05_6737 [Trichinella murrelli]
MPFFESMKAYEMVTHNNSAQDKSIKANDVNGKTVYSNVAIFITANLLCHQGIETLADNHIMRQEFSFSSSYPFDEKQHLELQQLSLYFFEAFFEFLLYCWLFLRFRSKSQLIPHAFEHIKSIYCLLVSHSPFSAQLSFSTALKLLSILCDADGTEKLKIRKMNENK